MRVALFTDADVFAGTERHIHELAMGLRAMDVEVCVACPTPSPLAQKADDAGIEVIAIPKRGLVDHAAVRQLARLLRADEIDIVHAHNGRTALSAAMAVSLSGVGQCVMTQHFLSPDHTTRRGFNAFVSNLGHRWVNGRVGHFIAISQAVRQEMLARRDAVDADISVVRNGITAPDASMLTDPRQIRRELGVEADSVLIVCAARLEPEKDVRTLVNAMAGVAIAHPTAVCAISGDGSQRQELQELARRALPERNVRFLGFREDVMSIINAADLFVLPSPAEPFGLVLLEAMALGKAVVATRAGGPREIVVDRGTGLLIAPGQAHEMADAICQLLSDEKARCRMGECGRDLYLQEFTTGRMAKQTILVYEQALTRKKCAPTLNVPVAS